MDWYSWDSDGDRFATVAGVNPQVSIALTPKGFGRVDEPVALRVVSDERGRLPLSDFPHTGLGLPKVLSQRAWSVLEEALVPAGRISEAIVEGSPGSFKIWYPTIVSSALDSEKSEILETIGGYRRLVRAVFLPLPLDPRHPILLEGFETQHVWISSLLRDLVLNSGLTGLVNKMHADT